MARSFTAAPAGAGHDPGNAPAGDDDDGNAPPDASGVYFERQRDALCAMHALNNAIGVPLQRKEDMEYACEQYLLEAEREGFPEQESDHTAPGGWYSSEVLAFAVRSTSLQRNGRVEYDMSLTPLLENPSQLHHVAGAVANLDNRHWVALRSVGGHVWCLDSVREAPHLLTPEAYMAFVRRHRNSFPILKLELPAA